MSVNKSANQIELFPLGKDKDIIYKALMKNEDLCELVLGENNKTGNFKNHFYNRLIIDTTQLEAKTYITMDTVIDRVDKKTKCIGIIIDVFSSLRSVDLTTSEQIKFYKKSYFGNRIDILLDIIKRTVSDLDIGIGETTLNPINPVKIIQPTPEFYGKRIIFQAYDF
ncbi:MAG: hypothetical protein LBE23_05890 [Vagococcus sp.]|jgi:hypothetical protein|nr:hypothetical protein [Vagococcus sp.]